MTFLFRPSSNESPICIECHPRSPQMPVTAISLPQIPGDAEPYHPFFSLEDFRFTDACIQNHVKAEVIDILLDQHSRIPNSPITLKNAKQMYGILDSACNLSLKVRMFSSPPWSAIHYSLCTT